MTENQKELIIEWLEHIAQMADSKKTVSGKVMKDSDALNEIKVLAKDSINYIKLHNQITHMNINKFCYEHITGKSYDEYINFLKEPKFHKGDWVIDKQGITHQIANVVENVTCHTYGYDIVGGGYFNDNTEGVRLWTIQDAKDGDVLAAHECLVLFKEIDGLNIRCYCTYHFMNNPSFYVDTLQNKDAFHPATKEQREQLEKAMADADFTFDFEKKELKKIEDEEYDGEDYGIDSLWHAKNILEKTLGKVDGYQTDDGILEHKCAISAVYRLYNQNRTWGEEDEDMIQALNACIDAAIKSGMNYISFDSKSILMWKVKTWLKSLRPQNTWKPSDEQMEALYTYIYNPQYFNSPDPRMKLVESVYKDLKNYIKGE